MSAPLDDEGFARALLGAARADRPAHGAASRAHEVIARAGGARTPLERRASAVLGRGLRVAVAACLVSALARPGASTDASVVMGTGGMTPGVGEASPPPRPVARPLAESGTGRFLPRTARAKATPGAPARGAAALCRALAAARWQSPHACARGGVDARPASDQPLAACGPEDS